MTNVRKNGDIRYSRQSISLPHLWPHLQGIDGMPQTPSGSNAANLMSPQKVNLRESSSVVEWEELMTTDDDGNDLKYYHNSSTGVTTWEKPDGFE